jgi:Holliday junction resolvasome RuvABC DNA-binding subunit
MHFAEVTGVINKVLPSSRQAYVQTVHNELIKDKRFVLVGRGLYALSEWGYEPGTVSQIIAQILKKEGPLSKEEIVKKVLQKRLVKENTILINLQNKKLFATNDKHCYTLRK